MSVGELACTYAALILHDDGIAVTAEKISTVVKAAKVNVESYWPSLFAKLCEKKDIEGLILNAGSGSVGVGAAVSVAAPAGEAAAPAAAAAASPGAEAKKEDEESDDDYITNLFD